jgi:single-strand selective monofunctional uracil DNA glycosylase
LYVIGVGRFVKERAKIALSDLELTIGSITHPSPANPKANKDWDTRVTEELKNLGIIL